MADYWPRIVDGQLRDALATSGAVQVVGPKWSGKTTTAEQVARAAVYFQDPDHRTNYLQAAAEQPSLLLQGDRPLLLDEWQDAPTMWDAVRFAVDRAGQDGQFILTGSAVPPRQEIRHSGTGRFSWLVMRSMSLSESVESSQEVSLNDVVEGRAISGKSHLGLPQIATTLVRGGWPASVIRGGDGAARARDYVNSVIESDISRLDGADKNPRRVRLLMRSLARNESSSAAMTTLRADMAVDEGAVSTNTIAGYLSALRRLYVLEEQEAWAPAVRSKIAIRTSPVRRFCDPSLPAALLGLTPEKLVVDFNTFGLLFESLCIRDLRIYAQSLGAQVFSYRDARGLETDAIIEFPDGRWGAIEIKLQAGAIPTAITTLTTIRDTVHSQHGGSPSFLAVITADGMAYRRQDGIYCIPIDCLRP